MKTSISYSGFCRYLSADGTGCRELDLNGGWFCSVHEPMFQRWRERWRAGLEADWGSGSFGYPYATDLVREGVSNGTWENVCSELIRLQTAGCAGLSSWVSDALVMRGDFAGAIREKRALIVPGRTHTHQSNDILNLCCDGGLAVAAREHVATNPLLTALGLTFAAEVEAAADEILADDGTRLGTAFVFDIARRHPEARKYGHHLFAGAFCSTPSRKAFCFYAIPGFFAYCGDICRRAENLYRGRVGVPDVGKGWVSETALFNLLCGRFGGITPVVHHYTAVWLGRQHLDIFLPELGIGVEYQGEQHTRGVDYFGGDDAFAQTAKRDAAKVAKCRRAGVRLLFVFHNEKLDEAAERLSAAIEVRLHGLDTPPPHSSSPDAP